MSDPSPLLPTPLGGPHADRFRALIRRLTGISLPAGKVPMIDQRLRRRVMAFNLPDTDTYLKMLLESPGMEAELRTVIDLITTNTTSFFREHTHFDILTQTIVPARMARARQGDRAKIKVWSAAASEGAEAYTIAIALAEERRRGRNFDFAVLGTDISERMLEKAEMAVYTEDQLSTVPTELQRRYFLTSRSGGSRPTSLVRVVPELRRFVRFRHMNLMDPSYPVDRDVDVIFLRNVLIYFDPVDKQGVIDRLTGHLAPGGYLIVGHSESMVVRHPDLRQARPTVFVKESS